MSGFPLLDGGHAPFVESLVPLPRAGALPARLFGEAGGVATLLAAAAAHRRPADERALASLWSRWYFAKLVPPVLLCGVVRGVALPLDIAGTGVVLGPNGLPHAIALPGAGAPCGGCDPFALFAPLVLGHVAAVVEALAAHVRLAPRILWNNAAVYADWALRRMAEDPGVPQDAARRALALVERPDWPGGRPNPFHAPVWERPVPGGVQRTRRQCCLLYRLPGEGSCRTCPRQLRSARPLDEIDNQSH
jgi:ferric iron reductase protein FhuF